VKLYRAFAVSHRLLGELRHDRRSMIFITLMPIIAMSLFGFTFTGTVQDINVAVVNLDAGVTSPLTDDELNLATDILGNIDTSVIILNYYTNYSLALEEVREARAWGMLYFPENFSENALAAILPAIGHDAFMDAIGDVTDDPMTLVAALQNLDPGVLAAMSLSEGEQAVIEMRLDESSINIAGAIHQEVAEAITATMEDADVTPAMSVDDSRPVYGEGSEFIDFFAPGIISLVAFIVTVLLTILTFAGERSSGTLDRILSSPMTVVEIVTGYAVAWSLVAVLQSALLIAIGVLVFGIAVVGNIMLAFLVVLMLAVGSQSLGMILSAAARTPFQAVQFIPIIIIPVLLLSGVLWPLEAIPGALRWLSAFSPVTYSTDALRSVMIRGWGLEHVWPEFAALLIFVLLSMGLSIMMLYRRRKA